MARSITGVYKIHTRSCASRKGAACNCTPTWQGWVPSPRKGGRPIRKNFKSQSEAKAWRSSAVTAAKQGKLAEPSRKTLKEAADELIAGMKSGTIADGSGKDYKPSTIRSYERALKLRVLPELGPHKLTAIRRAHVQALADGLVSDEGLSASSVQNTLDPLRVIYRRAVRRGLVAVNPTLDLELRRPKGRRERIASPQEAAELLAALSESEQAVWATAFYAGLRRAELRALRWDDIDLDARTIRVERSWDDREGVIDAKSEAGRRAIPILQALRPLLLAHQVATGRRGGDLCFGGTPSDAFVPSTVRSRALAAWKAENKRRETAQEAVDANEQVALLQPMTLHEARHTCASVFIAAGANPKAIQSIMGHATIQMTFDQYGHLMPGGLDEAAERADAYLEAHVTAEAVREK